MGRFNRGNFLGRCNNFDFFSQLVHWLHIFRFRDLNGPAFLLRCLIVDRLSRRPDFLETVELYATPRISTIDSRLLQNKHFELRKVDNSFAFIKGQRN